MSPNRSDYRKAQKRGMSAIEVARLKHETEVLYATAIEEAAIQDVAIACNVLMDEFWPKTSQKNIAKFLKHFWSMRSAVMVGVVTTEDLASHNKQFFNQDIRGKLFKMKGDGKIEKVAEVRERMGKITDLLAEAADALDGKPADPELSKRIREYIEFLE